MNEHTYWRERCEKAEATNKALLEALEAIAAIPGNLPDERLTTASGPNDARYRGEMLVSAREIARAAINRAKGE